MEGTVRSHLHELCQLASTEQDSQKLLDLTTEIVRMLEEGERRLQEKPAPSDAN